MLTSIVERYLALRRTLGFRLRGVEDNLKAYAVFAAARRESHVRTATVIAWAGQGSSALVRHVRFRDVARFARFVHAEDSAHEVPAGTPFRCRRVRPLPYIYSPDEIARILRAAAELKRPGFALRARVYSTLFGLIAACGLRISEAIELRVKDLRADGVLHVRWSKNGKSRFVPIHPTTAAALRRYIDARCRVAAADDHLFLSAANRRLTPGSVRHTFRGVLRTAGIRRASQARQPRIHDLRHTFATRALERCSTRRDAVARHVAALATYLGHADVCGSYWYLEASPHLLCDIASAAQTLMEGGAS